MMRRCFRYGILFLVLLPPTAHGQVSLTWNPIFQNTGSLAFALNPLSDSIIYAARSGTFFVSYDAGSSWQGRGAVPPAEIRNIAVCPADTSIILMYANGSLLRSANGGFGWTEVLAEVSMDGETIEFHPQNPDTVYFVDFRSGDLYASPNRGATWILRSNVSSTLVCSFSVNRFNPDLMIAGAGNTRINRSSDGGYSWENVKGGNPYFSEIPKLKWDPTDSTRAYAAAYLDNFSSVFRTGDGSASWHKPGLFGIPMWALDVEPAQGHVYLGSFGDRSRSGIYKSYDAGNSWQKFGNTPDEFCWMIKAANDSIVSALVLDSGFGVGAIYRIAIPPLGHVAGTITDSVSGLPVEVSSITVLETGDQVYAGNQAGSFLLGLPAGTYTLRFSAGGVQRDMPNVTVETGSTVALAVALPLDINQQAVGGSVLDFQGAPVLSRVLLDYTKPTTEQLTLIDTTEVSGSYRFDSLSSLNRYDRLFVEPLDLPYIGQTRDTVTVDTDINFTLDVADIIALQGEGEVLNTHRYHLALQSLDVTHVEVEADNESLSSATVGKTKKQAVLWYAGHDSSGIAQAVLDSLAAFSRSGHHLFMSGNDMVKYNEGHTLFRDLLGIGFADELTISGFAATVHGVPGNPIGTGLELRILSLNQDSADILSIGKSEVHKAFLYNGSEPDTTKTAGVNIDDTGTGGKAVVLGLDLDSQQTSLITEVLRRSFNFFSGITGIEELAVPPETLALYQNYPNPFNPGTAITFHVTRPSAVSLKIYNTLGQEVRTLIADEDREAGLHTVYWNGTNNSHQPVASGLYLYRIGTGSFVDTRQMLLLR
jgi:hypothetical protein